MILDTDKLLEAVKAAQKQSGENFFSVRMDVNVSMHSFAGTASVQFGSYTPNTCHTKNYDDPYEAIADTLRACADPGKLAAKAAELEEQARKLRSRVKGAAA